MTSHSEDLDQKMIETLFALGTNFFIQGKYLRAEVIFDGLLALNPQYVKASLALGEVFLQNHHYEKALAHFLAEKDKDVTDPRILRGAAKAYYLLERFDEAKRTLHLFSEN